MFLMPQKMIATKGHLTKLPSFMFRSVYFSNLKQVCRSSGKYLAAACKATVMTGLTYKRRAAQGG